MAKEKPLVSIVIPVYNGSEYLGEAIDSALAQTYPNVEVVVINDGSTDGGKTDIVAKSYGNKIRYFHKKNGGVATALNYGIKQMKGEWFSWLSHDDLYYPDKIEKQIEYASKHPNTKIIYSDFELVNAKEKHLHYANVKPGNIKSMRIRLLNTYPLNGCTMLINKGCFAAVGMFDPQLRTTQDYDLWFKLAGKYKFHHVPIYAIKSRQHAGQGSHTNKHKEEVDQLYSSFVNILTRKEINSELGSSSAPWLLSVAREYQNRGYRHAPIVALEKSLLFTNKQDPRYLFTRAYCQLPSGLTANLSNVGYQLRRKFFELAGKVKRTFVHESN